MILIPSLYFQNGDMEPQYHCVDDCDWCMGRCPRIALTEYVAYLQLFAALSYAPCLRHEGLAIVRHFTGNLILGCTN